jgi:drug/metabolite transporter (DMT)-like permease
MIYCYSLEILNQVANTMFQNQKVVGVLCALAAALIWSGFILVSRMGGISALTPYDVIAIRYITCSVLLFPVWLLFYRFNVLKIELIGSALIGGLAYAVFAFKGFELSSALHGGILLPGLIPVFISILSIVIIKDRLSKNKIIGLWMIILAIVLLFSKEVSLMVQFPEGDIYFVIGAFFWALYSVLINIWHISPWQATCSLAFITCLVYVPVYLVFLPKNIEQASLSEIGLQIFYQGFLATIIQMLLYVKAVKIIGAQGMGSFMALVPVLAGTFAVIYLKEPATWYLWVALSLVSMGVFISNYWAPVRLRKS